MDADFLHQPFRQLLPVLYDWAEVSDGDVEPVSLSDIRVRQVLNRSCDGILGRCSEVSK